jgi:hypothetical protein
MPGAVPQNTTSPPWDGLTLAVMVLPASPPELLPVAVMRASVSLAMLQANPN